MPRPTRDLTGQIFGRLTVVSRVEAPGQTYWNCRCECGQEVVRSALHILAGNTRSCGCLRKELTQTMHKLRRQPPSPVGEIWGRFTVLEVLRPPTKKAESPWLCRCECGVEKVIPKPSSIKSGSIVSCGCFRIERIRETMAKKKFVTPDLLRARTVWNHMHYRCSSPNYPSYHRYGGRGIRVCERWGEFANFLEDMGFPPKALSLDRVDNNGDYCPENCEWRTHTEQSRNRHTNRFVTYLGKTLTLTEWANKSGLSLPTLHMRLKRGWDLERALAPVAQPDVRVVFGSLIGDTLYLG